MNASHSITTGVPSADEMQFLEDQLYVYNSQITNRDDGQLFSIFIRDERQEIVAGIAGWTWAKACEIRTLWVHSAWRQQGYGRRLLLAAEQEALSRGCEVILISSYSFQAPEFYQHCGYEVAWQLSNFPPGYHQCYLIKRFAGSENRVGA